VGRKRRRDSLFIAIPTAGEMQVVQFAAVNNSVESAASMKEPSSAPVSPVHPMVPI
jgi:hypothetical protein